MDKNRLKYYFRVLLSITVIFVIAALISKVYLHSDHDLESDRWKIDYNQGWSVYYEGKEYNDVDISKFKLPRALNKGEYVTITNRLPHNLSAVIDEPVIRLYTHNAVVQVSINGRTRYSYGQELYEANKMVGSGRHSVNIEPSDNGKIVAVTFMATESSSFSAFDDMYIFNGNYMYQYELVSGKIPFTVSVFIIMLGSCVMIITIIASIRELKFLELFFAGCSSTLIGVWSLCYYGYVCMFDVSIYMSSIYEYIALYFFAVPMFLYFKNYMENTGSRRMKRFYYGILIIQLLADVVVCGLQISGRVHFPTTLPYMHVLIAVEIIYVLALLIKNAKKGDTSSKAILTGTIIMVLCIFTEYIIYALMKYLGINITRFKGFAAVGALIYIFTLIMAFAMQIAQRTKIETEKAVLYRMAYTDELTQIYNRRFCEQFLKSLTSKHMDYGIINLDLNGLKGINDTQGHQTGDSLIEGFAKLLKETFDGVGIVGRMGGDEFTVIVEGLAGFDYRRYIEELFEKMADANKKEGRFIYSTSYGYAQSTEITGEKKGTDKESAMVYGLADQRMYEYKRTFKSNQ
ncbi:MAG: diguanylate cyclase [Eubacteriales bacterium]|nr:diguanylate cyclase [Eubacteriales bacterium]